MSDLYEGVKRLCEESIERCETICSSCTLKKHSFENDECNSCQTGKEYRSTLREYWENEAYAGFGWF